MNLDEQKALSLFQQYVSNYNPQDGQVHLKIYHIESFYSPHAVVEIKCFKAPVGLREQVCFTGAA